VTARERATLEQTRFGSVHAEQAPILKRARAEGVRLMGIPVTLPPDGPKRSKVRA
jgi:hypothetical protein